MHGARYYIVADQDAVGFSESDAFRVFDAFGEMRDEHGNSIRLERSLDRKNIVPGDDNSAANRFIEQESIRLARNTDATIPQAYSRLSHIASDEEIPSDDQIAALASAMQVPTLPAPAERSAIYTYFGQIIAHDLTHTSVSKDPTGWLNLGTHTLNFASLFGDPGPTGRTMTLIKSCGGMALGQTVSGAFLDLPRHEDGMPWIADTRNDHNLLLAQMQVLIARFHDAVGRLCKPASEQEHQEITIRHLQSAVLDDFARSMLDGEVIDDVHKFGRAIVNPVWKPGIFQVPVEFSAAAFRFGHSLVRDSYDFSDALGERPLSDTFNYTGRRGRFSAEHRLPDSWSATWSSVVDSSLGDLNRTHSIDPRLAIKFGEMTQDHFADPPTAAGTPPFDMGRITLERGRSVRLPSGQTLVRYVNVGLWKRRKLVRGAPALNIAALVGSEIEILGDAELNAALNLPGESQTLANNTPLWFYILREAKPELPDGEIKLGSLGSRIVYETLHAACEASCVHILDSSGRPNFFPRPELAPQHPDKITLQEIIEIGETSN